MPRSALRLSLAISVAWLLSGCASGTIAELEGRASVVELHSVPFHSQVTDQCGPASLAMALNAAGVPVTPDELKARVYIPRRRGALQLEMLAAARHYGRIPYEVDPHIAALVAELDEGRPVLILQNLGATIAPIWHYAVVVGYIPDRKMFVLRSGDRPRLLVDAKKFARSWRRADSWGFVTLPPGDLPADPDANRYLRAVAALETTGGAALVIPAYRAATERWPQDALAWLGLGNASYARAALADAENAYRRALEISPRDAIALNNLAQVQLDRGCRDAALTTIDAAMEVLGASDPVRPLVVRTRDAILTSAAGSECR